MVVWWYLGMVELKVRISTHSNDRPHDHAGLYLHASVQPTVECGIKLPPISLPLGYNI